MQKRALAIHDICCVGRCSLTVALPILSAAGINTSIIPTALLSTHTGEFSSYTYLDLTNQLSPITQHLKTLALPFDAFYTGYLASSAQVQQVMQMMDQLCGLQTHIFVDPAFADHGQLYSLMEESMPAHMRQLCSCAHTIVPNLTEASFMLDKACPEELCYSPTYVSRLAKDLAALGPKNVVITDVSFDPKETGIAVYQRGMDEPIYSFTKRYDGIFHGTGDVFASFLLSGLLGGKSLLGSSKLALSLTYDSIFQTTQSRESLRYGVQFERVLPRFWQELNLLPNDDEDQQHYD